MHSILERIKYGIVLTSPFTGRLPRDINGIRDRYFLEHLSLIIFGQSIQFLTSFEL